MLKQSYHWCGRTHLQRDQNLSSYGFPCMLGTLSPNTGDVRVELDALPIDVLRTRIVAEVEKRMGLDALAEVRQLTASAIGCYTEELTKHEGP